MRRYDFSRLDEQRIIAKAVREAGQTPLDVAKWCGVAPGTVRNWFSLQNKMPDEARALINYHLQQKCDTE